MHTQTSRSTSTRCWGADSSRFAHATMTKWHECRAHVSWVVTLPHTDITHRQATMKLSLSLTHTHIPWSAIQHAPIQRCTWLVCRKEEVQPHPHTCTPTYNTQTKTKQDSTIMTTNYNNTWQGDDTTWCTTPVGWAAAGAVDSIGRLPIQHEAAQSITLSQPLNAKQLNDFMTCLMHQSSRHP